MSYEFYITIEGKTQKKFKGESNRKLGEGKLAGLAYEHEIKSPRDVSTGQASGKRQHSPITITKEWGAASPQIFQALCTNETLTKVLFEFVRTTPEGHEEIHYTITLTNATISSLKSYISDTRHDSSSDKHELEDVSFTYQRIELDNKWDKTAAHDDWRGNA
jgi:type VI secretion system secreted protein Hcp